MIGPQLQDDLFSILVGLRTHRFVIMANVEKKYRLVYLSKVDADQRIVWRDTALDAHKVYKVASTVIMLT